jgi:Uma2 family endonuclease
MKPASTLGHGASAIVIAMGEPARKRATYDDVLAAPADRIAELIDGALHLLPRPRLRHARAASRLLTGLAGFDSDAPGPGGWLILFEPELHLDADVLVPDLAGWRRARMPEMPDAPFTELAPDWCCEVLSPSTEDVDRADKLPIYARAGIAHVWLVDPVVRTLEILRLDGNTYRAIATHRGEAIARAEPFDAIALPLAPLWAR